ncbi:hypothetical protein [Cryptosporangium minutisporangium]|uniref:hypothetical protein n=1 Tax=Cryptosporangium minutisporangium TaxID=113569 RepID=UPI0035EBA6D7
MAKTLLLAWSTPVSEEAVDEFHRWYEETHVPELRAAVPSITAANRYRLRPIGPGPAAPAAGRFLCVYEIDEADAEAVAGALFGAIGDGRISQGQLMDMTGNPPALEWYEHL